MFPNKYVMLFLILSSSKVKRHELGICGLGEQKLSLRLARAWDSGDPHEVSIINIEILSRVSYEKEITLLWTIIF